MAKKSIIARNEKRKKLVERYASKREAIQQKIRNAESYEERIDAIMELQKLPRDASPIRVRRRCAISGRGKGVYRKFQLGRNMLRHFAMRGDIPGLVKSSW